MKALLAITAQNNATPTARIVRECRATLFMSGKFEQDSCSLSY
jgi:hypothetical protein